MNLNKISRAVGVACATMAASSAFALNASGYVPGNVSNIYISGASAQDNGLLVFALKNCVAGSMHRYSISNNVVYYCTPIAGLGQTSTSNQLAIHKLSTGGSGNGVAPVNNGQTLPFLDLSDIAANCASTVTVTNASFGTFTGYINVACTAASNSLTSPAITRLGLSDVEPAFFSNTVSNLTADPISTLIFGVPVSTNVYRALQASQGLAVGTCTNQASTIGTLTGTNAVTQRWEAEFECMPSLTRAQIVTAFTQGGTWAGIGVTGVAGPIYVARRVNSSGTQKTFEALISRSPNTGGETLKSCVVGTDPFLAGDNGNDDTETGDTANRCQTGPALATVFSGSGGGNVRTCLTDHAAGGRGAIGMLTAEDLAPGGPNGFRFIKVNGGTSTNRGAAPRDVDVASGAYTFWTVSSVNYTSFVTGDTNYNNFLTRFKSDFADPVGIQILQPFGLSGNMANYSQLPDPKPARDFTGASGLNPWDRLVGGLVSDNCQQGKATQF